MRLSEAIRLGSSLKPQHHSGNDFHVVIPSPRKAGDVLHLDSGCEASCAMGAAIDAAGLSDANIEAHRGWPREWRPILHLQEEPCPACGRDHGNVYENIIALNDRHNWTRERIADWVELLERRAVADALSNAEPAVTTAASASAERHLI